MKCVFCSLCPFLFLQSGSIAEADAASLRLQVAQARVGLEALAGQSVRPRINLKVLCTIFKQISIFHRSRSFWNLPRYSRLLLADILALEVNGSFVDTFGFFLNFYHENYLMGRITHLQKEIQMPQWQRFEEGFSHKTPMPRGKLSPTWYSLWADLTAGGWDSQNK